MVLPENNRGLLGILDKGRVLDVVEVAEVVGEWLEGGEDDGVAEDAGLHAVLEPPVEDQLVLAGETAGADRAVVLLLLVVDNLVLPPRLVGEEIFLAPNTPAPPQVVLEEEVSAAVLEDHVTDVAAVLLTGVAGAHDDTVLLGGRAALLGLLGQRAVTEVILQRTVRECFQQSKVGEIMEIFDVIYQLEALQCLVTEQALK